MLAQAQSLLGGLFVVLNKFNILLWILHTHCIQPSLGLVFGLPQHAKQAVQGLQGQCGLYKGAKAAHRLLGLSIWSRCYRDFIVSKMLISYRVYEVGYLQAQTDHIYPSGKLLLSSLTLSNCAQFRYPSSILSFIAFLRILGLLQNSHNKQH